MRSTRIVRLVGAVARAAAVFASTAWAGDGGGGSNGGNGAELTATDVGVTADEIRIAVVADVENPLVPGFFAGAVAGVEGAAEYINDNGGIAGRKVVVDFIDSHLNADDARNAVIQACAEDFAIVGSGAVQDNFWPSVGAACDLIDIAGFSVTPEKAGVAGQDPEETRSVQPGPGDRHPRHPPRGHRGRAAVLAGLVPDQPTQPDL